MESNFDLLDVVLPEEGRYCVVGIGLNARQELFDDRDEFDKQAQAYVSQNRNVYFGCAKYGTLNNRKHENAEYFRALWMDIDCGEEKATPDKYGKVAGYIDQATGLEAVRDFCKAKGLPRPVIVNSGYGLHFYWILSETLRRDAWNSLAKRLRALALENGLHVDPSVFEASRVLRIPGTYNFKQSKEPKEVVVLNSVYEAKSYEFWKELLQAPEVVEREFAPRRLSPLMSLLQSSAKKQFKAIMLKTAKGDGCAQLQHCYENQDSISYNLWRSALSVATFCEDREWAIHFMSERHPQYRPGDTEAKAADIGGPHLCTTFANENPELCGGCQYKDKIRSPIMLGLEIEAATEEETEEVAEVEQPKSAGFIPPPYFRAKSGAIYMNIGDSDPALIYENTLYVTKRMTDPVLGETALINLHLPRDGLKEFPIPLASLVVKEKLREELAKHGVAAGDSQVKNLFNYLITSVKNLQVTNKAEIMRTQFGWTDKDSKIIIGDREITKDGVFYSPPTSTTSSIAESMKPQGSLEKWKEVFNLYARKGLEPNAFAALTGFGSFLLKFTGVSGAIINVIYPKSGSGKSTTLYVCNSVVGHPKKLGSMWKDTFNVKMHRLGVMNNLANTIDEITNTSPQEFSDLAYSISQGRGKNRMKASANEERVNLTSWQGITLTSANASFYEKMGLAKDSPDGESMRLFEYRIAPSEIISTAEGKEMFDHTLLENYGYAGDIFAQWLVNNLEEAIATLRQVQAKIDAEVQFTSRERFWSAIAACNITGGLISKRLNLHDYDMKAVYDWLKDTMISMRDDVGSPTMDMTEILGQFIDSHLQNVLVVDGKVDSRTNLDAAPILEPRGELSIRYEPDTKRMYIAVSALRKYCAERQIGYKDLVSHLESKRICVGIANKRMAKGMKIIAPPVRTLELNTSRDQFFNLDNITGNEDREHQL